MRGHHSMLRKTPFELQGHRGARGLKPENTLPSFEAAFDAGVSSIETDVHLSADDIPVLFHDGTLSDRMCRVMPGARAGIDFHEEPFLSSFTAAELRAFLVDRNPDPKRFPEQTNEITPLAGMFAEQSGIDPYTMPTLSDLLAFAQAYAGALGKKAGKTPDQRRRAGRVRFDLELKRVPYYPEIIGDGYVGAGPGLLESKLVEVVRSFNLAARTVVRSFDHRAVRALKKLEPAITRAVLIAETTPVWPAALARAADAAIYAPDFRFIDLAVIQQAHAKGLRVLPWTVNEPADWERLIAWGVDGLTTDYPDRLAVWLGKQHVAVM